ncbi:hypothetical protein M3650_04085 [Paenibacillus sp. MER TA 81-3]|uniref:hypothetical protein n=1 Tax=Paenibacillus sp. MER TA 81-3 TaxID=2939573 RepID=UPI00203F0A6D|nr:hypothetical protein [Paenibacillus sp. MER TA 81-3]MCM3337834.1 hypothetical protein [Paenibacillus sp. MER TA 81-3]
MLLSVFAPAAFATETAVAQNPVQQTRENRILEIGKDDFSQSVLEAAPVMDKYIIIGKESFSLDPVAKDIVSLDVYNQYAIGVERMNDALRDGYLSIQNGQIKIMPPSEFQTNAFSNAYWWGVAVTYSDSETKSWIYALNHGAGISGFLASMSSLIPGGQIVSFWSAVAGFGALWFANELSYKNDGRGVTFNFHWLPIPSFVITSNG